MAPERLEHYLVPTMENQLVCLIARALRKLSLLALSLSIAFAVVGTDCRGNYSHTKYDG